VPEGNIELAQNTSESHYLASAADTIDRSQALIEDLLTPAREGDNVDETESVELAEVAERSWQTTDTQQARLDVDTPRVIEADRSRFQQLFENLSRSSVEYGGNDVTVSVGLLDDGSYVADTGPGIPESDREGVFEVGYLITEDGAGFGLLVAVLALIGVGLLGRARVG